MALYETLGQYYDALVKDDEAADKWVDWIESFAPGRDFLELACGSGEISKRLAAHHHLDALDLSASMLEAAKAKDSEKAITFLQGDMRNLEALGQYDAIGCFCDSFNYLIEKDEVRQFFKDIYAHLKNGGLFLFDSHGLSRLYEFAEDYEEAGTFDDGTQVQWIISCEKDWIYQDFAFYLNGRTIEEHHLQRVWHPQALEGWLQEAGFEVIDLRGDFGEEPLESCEKYFFACRKKEGLHPYPPVCEGLDAEECLSVLASLKNGSGTK